MPDWKANIGLVIPRFQAGDQVSKYQTTPKIIAKLADIAEKKATAWDVFMAKELLTARAKLPPEEECVENEDTVAAEKYLQGEGVDGDPSLYGGDLLV